MISRPIESEYPLSFRKADTEALSSAIKELQSVEFIGMKRVGISNFLRYFLYNPIIFETHFGSPAPHSYLFVPIDLNNLIETEKYPFWLLTFKRILDAVEQSELTDETKLKVQRTFDTAMQYKETFFIVDGIRKVLHDISQAKVIPVIFFIRFDRLLDIITPSLFANLQGLYDAVHGKLVYVFTTHRRLMHLKPEVFDKNTMSIFSHPVYLQPALQEDMETIFSTFEKKYDLKITKKDNDVLIALSGGHVNYLQLLLIIIKERIASGEPISKIMKDIQDDERVVLQSEELYSYLEKEEKEVLGRIANEQEVSYEDKDSEYIWKTGMVVNGAKPLRIFSPLFESYVRSISERHAPMADSTYLTQKEHKLFTLLEAHIEEICERDLILETVWAEYEAIGVSDWAVDRLVARLRKKLKNIHSEYRIKTIRTRGFMLVLR